MQIAQTEVHRAAAVVVVAVADVAAAVVVVAVADVAAAVVVLCSSSRR